MSTRGAPIGAHRAAALVTPDRRFLYAREVVRELSTRREFISICVRFCSHEANSRASKREGNDRRVRASEFPRTAKTKPRCQAAVTKVRFLSIAPYMGRIFLEVASCEYAAYRFLQAFFFFWSTDGNPGAETPTSLSDEGEDRERYRLRFCN